MLGLGGETFRCGWDVIALDAVDPPGVTDLELKVVSTPEPSTWALMALGFTSLGSSAAARPAPAQGSR